MKFLGRKSAEAGRIDPGTFMPQGDQFRVLDSVEPRQGQVRTEGAVFPGYTEAFDGGFGFRGQRGQFRPGGDTNGEDAGLVWVREPSRSSQGDLERRRTGDSGQRPDELIEAGFGPLADEFRGNVQVAGRGPAHRRQRAQLADQPPEFLLENLRDIDTHKEPHAQALFSNESR